MINGFDELVTFIPTGVPDCGDPVDISLTLIVMEPDSPDSNVRERASTLIENH